MMPTDPSLPLPTHSRHRQRGREGGFLCTWPSGLAGRVFPVVPHSQTTQAGAHSSRISTGESDLCLESTFPKHTELFRCHFRKSGTSSASKVPNRHAPVSLPAPSPPPPCPLPRRPHLLPPAGAPCRALPGPLRDCQRTLLKRTAHHVTPCPRPRTESLSNIW